MNGGLLKLISCAFVFGLPLVVGSNLSAQILPQVNHVVPQIGQAKAKGEVASTEGLFNAVAGSPAEITRVMLIKAGDVNIKNDEGLTLLMATVLSEKADPETIEWLFAAGVNVHQTTKDGKTALDLLASSTSQKADLMKEKLLTEWLKQAIMQDGSESLGEMQGAIDAGAKVNYFVDERMGYTLLMYAIMVNNHALEKVKLLLVAGADPNLVDADESFTALTQAVSSGNIEVARLLLAAGANVNEATGDKGYRTALLEASLKLYGSLPQEQEQMVRLLIENGAISRPNDLVRDPLHMGLATGASPKVITMLLRAGSMVTGSTPPGGNEIPAVVAAATDYSDPENIKIILAAGGDLKARTKKGEDVFEFIDKRIKDPGRKKVFHKIILTTELVASCADGPVEEVKKIIARGADVNRPNAFQTPLMAAATDTEFGVAKAKLLLAEGAKINGRNGDGMAPLQVAAARDNVDMVKFLLEKGAEVNAVDSYGRSAIWEALHQGRVKCYDSAKNKEKHCPSLKLQEQVVELLQKAGAVSQPTPEALKAL